MKTIIFYGFLLLGYTATSAQNDKEVQTISIKIENFISYIAAQEAAPSEQRIFLAIETGPTGLEAEERFYIEQGIKLLSKRITQTSLIAIGSYGSQGQLIVPYTAISDIKDFSDLVHKIQLDTSLEPSDGIDIAFQNASLQFKEGIDNVVMILRNNHVKNSTPTLAAAVTKKEVREEKKAAVSPTKLGGALALTALTILPDVLEIIKN